ncbi:hypothetical protein AB6A40_004648 [Gnathostoma spinigerum]|uniref:Vacuolar protein sorting-associated protein 72 homolog n=1 Tax=Gnathostoma spinigerum TaxID=75299 RepID=A0ABD6ED39_9BILA
MKRKTDPSSAEKEMKTCSSKEVDMENEANDEESEEEPVDFLCKTRERRSNAGSKMAVLMESVIEEDDFYKNAYGGTLMEDDADDAYVSPVESDHDEVDSDFDQSEEEDQPISDEEEKQDKKRKRNVYKEPRLGDSGKGRKLFEKNKKWVMARMGGRTVAANTVSPETQAERLLEAEETERLNIASLQKYEQYEIERKKKRDKVNASKKLLPPFVRTVDGPNGKWMILPDVKVFQPPERKTRLLCAVTSRPAKYRDPVTGLSYANVEAFKLIREKYVEYLKTIKNNPSVTAWLEENC